MAAVTQRKRNSKHNYTHKFPDQFKVISMKNEKHMTNL